MWSVRLTIKPGIEKPPEKALPKGAGSSPEDAMGHCWIPVGSLVNDQLEEIYTHVVSTDGRVFTDPGCGTVGFGEEWWGLISSFPFVDLNQIMEQLSYKTSHVNSMWAVDMRHFGIAVEVDADNPLNFSRRSAFVFELERKVPDSAPPPVLPSVTKPHIEDPMMQILLLMMTTSQMNPFKKVRINRDKQRMQRLNLFDAPFPSPTIAAQWRHCNTATVPFYRRVRHSR